MALIYWAELYFRSLKRIKVLSLLTKYLLQYRRLSIPHVGTFELVQQSPEFNVVDKLISPPSFRLNWNNNDVLTDHQLSYLAASFHSNKEKIREELDALGKRIQSNAQKKAFNWNGIAALQADNGKFEVERDLLQLDGLETVPAHKIIRQNVEHSMLVGDQQMTSQQMTDAFRKKQKRKSYAVVIGWVLFFLTLVAIIFLLYKSGFNPLASGLR
ncbi:MAG: hypothetical protein ACTHMD_05570 [Flavisolibacter sp.]